MLLCKSAASEGGAEVGAPYIGAGLWDEGQGLVFDACVGMPTCRARVQVVGVAVKRGCAGPEYTDRGWGV